MGWNGDVVNPVAEPFESNLEEELGERMGQEVVWGPLEPFWEPE